LISTKMSSQNKKQIFVKKTTPKQKNKQLLRRSQNRKKQVVQGRKTRYANATNDVRLNYADGVRPNIMVVAGIANQAAESFPLGILTVALNSGFTQDSTTTAYAAYYAFMLDLKAILSQATSPISGRLKYLNNILASYLPKSVRFKTGTLAYSWGNVDSIQIANKITVRNFSYYLYIKGPSVNPNGWPLMVVPPIPASDAASYPALAEMYAILDNESVDHLRYVPNIEFGTEYKTDVSGFAAVSPYYGQGNSSASGASFSCESEVPFKSNVLATFSAYSVNAGRVARNFNLGSGDSTCAGAFALIPGFAPKVYNTRYPIQYAFLDLDEVVLFAQAWYISLVSKFIATSNGIYAADVLIAVNPFTISAGQFRIAVRQSILSMFSNSQAMGQFLTYNTNRGSFEALRCGTNAHGANRATILLPEIMVENLRMLISRFLLMKDVRFYNEKNQIVVIPVWGVYVNAELINQTGSFYDNELGLYGAPLFAGSSTDDPSVVDGTDSAGGCCDLNCALVEKVIDEWNERINILKQASLPTTYLAGNGNGALLLQTRFAKFVTQDAPILMSSFTPLQRLKISPNCIKKVPLTRTKSKGIGNGTNNVEYESYFVPPFASLFSQHTNAYSSLPIITEAQKLLFNYLIYPTIIIEDGETPTQRQYRVAVAQSSVLEYKQNDNSLMSRGTQLVNFGKLCAPGVAAQSSDELSSVIKTMADMNKGGFIGDVLSLLASTIPF